MSSGYDVCVIGSGAGGAPVACTLAEAGYHVLLLEKGPWYEREQFLKDEIELCRRPRVVPDLADEPQVWSWTDERGRVQAQATDRLWNGSLVGGASVLMSGFFLRLKPADFLARTEYGPVPGADVADWPIGYDELEPYYARVEREVGVSGLAVDLPAAIQDRRSTPDFPLPPTREHPFADHVDRVLRGRGLHPLPVPRAVLPEARGDRRGCAYSGYCAQYGCRTGAKGSALGAWIPRALATGRCDLRPRTRVTHLASDARGLVRTAEYVDREGRSRRAEATVFVVACQAIETARLLLTSRGPRHRAGLANGSGLVGRNLLSSTFGGGGGVFPTAREPGRAWSRSAEPFVNRALQDWYFLDDPSLGRRKGGTLNLLPHHPNPIRRAELVAAGTGAPVWGAPLKARLGAHFRSGWHVKFEVFGEWLCDQRARVTLDPHVRDRWGQPVARVRTDSHPRSRETAAWLGQRGVEVLETLGAQDVRAVAGGGASTNLMGGTCRFGHDPARSVLDPDCRAHDVENLFVTDGSFMPSGGGVPFTFTIYANALRVSERIIEQLGGVRR